MRLMLLRNYCLISACLYVLVLLQRLKGIMGAASHFSALLSPMLADGDCGFLV